MRVPAQSSDIGGGSRIRVRRAGRFRRRCAILSAMRFRFNIYFGGDSPVHRCDARVKMILLLAYSIVVFAASTWWGIGTLAAISIAAFVVAHVPVSAVCRSLAPVFVLAALTAVFYAIGNPAIEGAVAGLLVAARMIVLVAGSFVVCFTTTSTQMLQALRSLMRPLRAVRVPVDDVAFTLSLATRFIPVVGEEAGRIRAAQAARAGAGATGAMERVRRWGATFSSVFVGLFRRSDSLAQAMDARCYGAAPERGSLSVVRFSPGSAIALIAGCGMLVCVGVFL